MLILFLCGLSATAGLLLLAGCGGGNEPPVAGAGVPATVFAGHPARLDGTGSSDPNDDSLTYAWNLDAKPEGSAATLGAPDQSVASLLPDVRGEYAISLTVYDGKSYGEAARQSVEAQPWFSLADPSIVELPWNADVSDRPGAISGSGEPRVSNSTDPMSGAAWGDYDDDGDPDLYVGSTSIDSFTEISSYLYQNNGDGTFTYMADTGGAAFRVTPQLPVGPPPPVVVLGNATRSVLWGDYDGDGDLDLAVANHARIERDEEKKVHWLNEASALYRNDGDGTFTDVAAQLGILQDPITPKAEWDIATVKCGSPWQPFWFDYDGDGNQDLFFTCETGSGTNLLYHNNGDGTFADVTQDAGFWGTTGHGIDAGDYDGDGDPDLIVTDAGTNHLWRNEGDGTFREVTSDAGVVGRGGVGWGTAFFDYDNDGDLDIGIAAGDWTTYGDSEEREKYNANLFYENKGDGTFANVSEKSGLDLVPARGFSTPSISRGLALADYDGDGGLDVYFTSSDDWNYLHHNDIAGYLGNNWVKVKLKGTDSNTFGIGAMVKVTAGNLMMTEQLLAGGSFLCMDAPVLHFGLAGSTVVDEIEVTWPSGTVQVVSDVQPNQTITITEGS